MNDELKQRILVIFAITFTFVLYIQYSAAKAKQEEAKQAAAAQQNPSAQSATAQTPAPPVDGATTNTTPALSANESTTTEDDPQLAAYQVRVRRKEFDAVFSARGAGLVSYTLEHYTRSPQPENEYADRVCLVDELAQERLSLALATINTTDVRKRLYRLERIPAEAEIRNTETLPEGVVQEGDELVFSTTAFPWTIRKIYNFSAKDTDGKRYGFSMRLELQNISKEPQPMSYTLAGLSGILPDDMDPRSVVEALSASQPDLESPEVNVLRWSMASLGEAELPADREDYIDGRTPLAWIGMKNRFFTTLLLLDDPTSAIECELNRFDVSRAYYTLQHKETEKLFQQKSAREGNDPSTGKATKIPISGELVLKSSLTNVAPSQSVAHTFRFYGGPADEEMLAFDPRLEGVIQYFWGFIAPLSRLFTKILYYLSAVFGNYGVAIIMLTIILRTLMHPLTRKALASGHKMQKVQPRHKELQRKYANDRAKLQQETMRLWQEEGVSPVGGCLPMLLQIPIFFALYGAFSQSFAGRHASFIPGWIDDLSQPDQLFTWNAMLPVIGNAFNLLPVLYMVLSMFQMSMQPKSEDPQMASQQRMMRFMPIMFMFFFYQMPSGLVLYFTCSTAYVIAEHWIVKKHLHKKDEGNPPAGAGQGTRGFQPATPSGASAGVGISKSKGKRKH